MDSVKVSLQRIKLLLITYKKEHVTFSTSVAATSDLIRVYINTIENKKRKLLEIAIKSVFLKQDIHIICITKDFYCNLSPLSKCQTNYNQSNKSSCSFSSSRHDLVYLALQQHHFYITSHINDRQGQEGLLLLSLQNILGDVVV